ncbi:hypothetical protein BDV41DRAFT_537188 [Aspergillus transmontanensis]|uniref:Uncharacterized protein n=1 Tax=Aspergillus transmontanensis TaxID=1034304 RepID=A0A5N6VXL1_9EURO|nr:hypothetical protein BDV41DRAFT_537188 [Aspergillus transmontanensis]
MQGGYAPANAECLRALRDKSLLIFNTTFYQWHSRKDVDEVEFGISQPQSPRNRHLG